MLDGGINLFDAFTRLPLQNECVAQLLRPVASSLLPGGDMLTIRIGGRTASSHQFGVTLERIALESRRSGIMPSRLLSLQTHRSMSLAIRHHAITRSDSGAQVARLDGPASCLRASPSLAQVARFDGPASCLRALPSLAQQRSGGPALTRLRRRPSHTLNSQIEEPCGLASVPSRPLLLRSVLVAHTGRSSNPL